MDPEERQLRHPEEEGDRTDALKHLNSSSEEKICGRWAAEPRGATPQLCKETKETTNNNLKMKDGNPSRYAGDRRKEFNRSRGLDLARKPEVFLIVNFTFIT